MLASGPGADRIIVYLDDPEDPAQPTLGGDPRMGLRPCTEALWNGLGLSSGARFVRRQRFAMNQAYRETETGWALILDADELIWIRGRPVNEALAALAPAVNTVSVKTAEQVRLSDGGEALRLPIPRPDVNRIYGDDCALFRPRMGLVGHFEGKSFYRAGLEDIKLRLHWAEDENGDRLKGPIWGHEGGAYLVHYVSPGYERWRAKKDWRAGSHGFGAALKDRIAAISQMGNPEAGYRALYTRLHSLTPEEEAALDEIGGLMRRLPSRVV